MFPPTTRILIADDMVTVRESLRGMLMSLGYTNILEAGNGDDAKKILDAQLNAGAPIGLVLCDWEMPGLKGIDLLKAVKSDPRMSRMPFVMITSQGAMPNVLGAVEAGVSHFLVKPIEAKTLQDKLLATWRKHNG